MCKHFSYTVRRDRGFAPHAEKRICTLCCCKKSYKDKNGREYRNIEELATIGSWIVGTGGRETGKYRKLLYAMEVTEILKYSEFRKKYSKESAYLTKTKGCKPVLVSNKFYYFGDKAIDLEGGLKDIIKKGPKYKYISDDQVEKLKKFIKKKGVKLRFRGKPNHPQSSPKHSICKKERGTSTNACH